MQLSSIREKIEFEIFFVIPCIP